MAAQYDWTHAEAAATSVTTSDGSLPTLFEDAHDRGL